MSAINDKVYARVHEKAKEQRFNEQEINAIDTARKQLNSHTSLGGFTGASIAFLIGKQKKFKPLGLLALAGGGYLIGTQVGLISGAMAGVNTIKTLPNPQRLVNVFREVQQETLNARGGPLPKSPASTTGRPTPINDTASAYSSLPSSTQSQSQQTQVDDAFASEDLAVHGGYARSGSEFQSDQAVQLQQQNGWNTNQQQQPTSDRLSSWQQKQQQQQQQQSRSSKWDEIRSKNLPNTAWTRIRQQAADRRTDAKSIEQAKAQRVVALKEREASFDDLPRTREEAEQRITGRKNQWGDMAG